MRFLILAGIWIMALIIDGMVFPALWGTPAGFGTVIFLIVFTLSFGIHRWVIGWGICVALVAELMFGSYPGTIVGSWLILIEVWYILNRFFSLKSSPGSTSWIAFFSLTAFGMVLFVLAEVSQWAIIRLIYDRMLTFSTTREIISLPYILLTACVELVILLAVFNFIFFQRQSIYD